MGHYAVLMEREERRTQRESGSTLRYGLDIMGDSTSRCRVGRYKTLEDVSFETQREDTLLGFQEDFLFPERKQPILGKIATEKNE
jgi:hypothetical protein